MMVDGSMSKINKLDCEFIDFSIQSEYSESMSLPSPNSRVSISSDNMLQGIILIEKEVVLSH